MKIGIDASRLTEKGRTGTENYLYNLVRALARNDKRNEYVLHFRNGISESFEEELFLGNENFSYEVLDPLISWTQVNFAFDVFHHDIDIVFCPWHTIPILAKFSDAKIVSVIHDLTGKKIPTMLAIKFSDRVIAVSHYTQSQIEKKYNNIEEVEVILEAYPDEIKKAEDVSVKNTKTKYEIEKDYILFLGTISPRKNLERMIEAYEGLENREDLEFIIAGKLLPEYRKLEDLIEDVPGVRYIGRVPSDDLSALYTGAKFLSFVSEEEGFGLPILEAMSCGIPVLTSNLSATKEVSGDAALLVDPFSVEDIRKGMKRLLEDDSLVWTLTNNGYKNLEKFSWDKSAKELISVFEKL